MTRTSAHCGSPSLRPSWLARIQKLLSADELTRRQYGALTSKIATESAALATLNEKLADAQGAKDRIPQLQQEREAAYQRVFEAIAAEQAVLEQLYAPLMARLQASSGTLGKLSFSVARTADVQKWASEAEDGLIDLRKQGPFRGRGTLVQRAEEELRTAWESGSAVDVSPPCPNSVASTRRTSYNTLRCRPRSRLNSGLG